MTPFGHSFVNIDEIVQKCLTQTEVKSIVSEFCLENWCKANLGRNSFMDNLVGSQNYREFGLFGRSCF